MSLGKTITLLLLGVLVGSFLLVGGVAFFTTRASITSLSDSLLKQIDEGVQQKLQSYFDGVEPTVRFMDEAVFDDPNPIENWHEPALILSRYLKTESQIMYLYYAERDSGNLLGVLRTPEGELVVSRLHEGSGPLTKYYVFNEETEVMAEIEFPDIGREPYDARARPWFLEAVKLEGLVWTAPYQFATGGEVGITAAMAKRDEEGSVLGVYAADFVLNDIAEYLDNMEVGRTGAAFLMLDDGSFPVPINSRMHTNSKGIREALESEDWRLEEVMVGGSREHRFSYKGVAYSALIQQIDLPGETKYYAGAIIPDSDFLGVVWRNAWITVGLASVVIVVAAILGVWLARRVTDPLAQIGEQLEQIGRLSFREGGVRHQSRIKEVSLFSDSVGKMEVSLKAFSRYVPRDLVRQLLAQGSEAELGGKIEGVTVVFTDLAGFTKMSEGMPADVAFRELSEFLEIVANTQQRYGGITSSFTGDGTLALFNAPEPLEAHGSKACIASWECLRELKKLNERRVAEGKAEFKARIGINTADVLLGNLGTRDRFAYTAIGDGVNLASRIEGLNKLYGTEILVGQPTRDVDDSFEWRRIDRIAVVGRSQPTILFEPLGPKGEVEKEILACRDKYEKALDLYFNQEFEQAAKLFREVHNMRPNDSASAVMAERCSAFMETAPSANWDGTFEAPFK